jgi:hypothetical protein
VGAYEAAAPCWGAQVGSSEHPVCPSRQRGSPLDATPRDSCPGTVALPTCCGTAPKSHRLCRRKTLYPWAQTGSPVTPAHLCHTQTGPTSLVPGPLWTAHPAPAAVRQAKVSRTEPVQRQGWRRRHLAVQRECQRGWWAAKGAAEASLHQRGPQLAAVRQTGLSRALARLHISLLDFRNPCEVDAIPDTILDTIPVPEVTAQSLPRGLEKNGFAQSHMCVSSQHYLPLHAQLLCALMP